MIDHISLAVSDLTVSSNFYRKILEPLGLIELVARERTVGFGKAYPEIWLTERRDMVHVSSASGFHVCLRSPSRDAVKAFHQTALKLGGLDAGAPANHVGTQTTYFGAFILDLDGNRIEVASFPRGDASQ